jgi:hypothetical protein
MAKPLHAGGEVDSWCTKCKLVLNHRIIAMVGPKPVRVECSTCGSHHNFRARAPGEKDPSATTRSSNGSGAGGSTRAPARDRGPTQREITAREREQTWEKAVLGRTAAEFKPYRITALFNPGDLVKHVKFGDGVVMRIVDARKVEVLFRDEPRTLAQGMTD